MAYIVAQLRKNNSTTYMTQLNVIATTCASPNKFAESSSSADSAFQDFALQGNF